MQNKKYSNDFPMTRNMYSEFILYKRTYMRCQRRFPMFPYSAMRHSDATSRASPYPCWHSKNRMATGLYAQRMICECKAK